MPYAEVNGQHLYFEDSGGDGPPVVLAHGFLMDHEMFAPQVAALAPEHRVITWDERGFGLTEFDGKPFTYWDSAADCIGLMDALGIDQAVVGGMSQGGFLSLRTALTAPERVRALILLDTQSGVEKPENIEAYSGLMQGWITSGVSAEVAAFVADLIIADDTENPRWIAKWMARDPSFLTEAGACLLGRDDVTGRLGEITCPALVVHGTADTAIPPEHATLLAEGLPGAGPVVWIEGAAHAANLTHPEPVNAAVLAFLRDL